RPYLLYDFREARWQALAAARRDGCAVCGQGGYAALGDREPPPSVPSVTELPSLPVLPAQQSRIPVASTLTADGRSTALAPILP
ncbi:MAG: hypothetical protein ACRDJN_27115, partial [Chloroflexota bacterium]